MSKAFNGNIRLTKWFVGNTKITKGFMGNTLIYSSGYVVYYHVGPDDVRTVEVDDGANCIDFAPEVVVSGWELHGWREDNTASATVLDTRIANSDDIHLYAVLKRAVNLIYNGNGATSGSTNTQTDFVYYNNGSYKYPVFTLLPNGYARTDCSFIGKWAINSVSGTQYSVGASVTLSSNTTFYAKWKYNDITIPLIVTNIAGDDQWPGYFNAYITGNIDTAKYSSVTVHINCGYSAAFRLGIIDAYLECGGGSVLYATAYKDAWEQSFPANVDADITVNFTSTSGNTQVYNRMDNSRGNSTMDGGFTFSNCRVVGRIV